MTLAFLLSMPGNNAWNGRWSGYGGCYAIVMTLRNTAKAKSLLAKNYYSYNFGDGWRAAVQVKLVDKDEARSLRKSSKGFCGYDWMVKSILLDGAIYGPTQPKPEPGALDGGKA